MACKGFPPLLLLPILHPPVTTCLPVPGGLLRPTAHRKGAAPCTAAPGNAPGPWRTVESATHVVCRLGGAPCSASRPLAWASDRGGGGIGLPGCRILCVDGRGLHIPALRGAASASQRRGLAPQGRYPQDDGAGVLRSARHRRGAGAGAGAGGVEPPAVFAIRAACRRPRICRRARPVRAPHRAGSRPGARPALHRVSNAMVRPSRPSSSLVGPPPSREPSCSTTGGASVAPTACPAGDAAPAGALRRWCGRRTRDDRPSHHASRYG